MASTIFTPLRFLFAPRALPLPSKRFIGWKTYTPASPNALRMVPDMSLWVKGRINGTVKEHNAPSDLPLRRQVRLFRQRDGRIIDDTWSDATTGAYSFVGVQATEKYFVTAFDYLLNYNAVIKSDITPDIVP